MLMIFYIVTVVFMKRRQRISIKRLNYIFHCYYLLYNNMDLISDDEISLTVNVKRNFLIVYIGSAVQG